MRLHPLVLASVATNSMGNILLTLAMKRLSPSLEASFQAHNFFKMGWTVVTDPTFMSGVALLTTFFVIFLTLLSKMDLSYVLPVTSVGYILTALLAAVILGEKISVPRWAGIACIALGVYLVSRSEKAAPAERPSAERATVTAELPVVETEMSA